MDARHSTVGRGGLRGSGVVGGRSWLRRAASGGRTARRAARRRSGTGRGARPLMDVVVFVVAAAIILVGAVGVVLRGNPVHAALNLVMTLFGVAVLFVAQDA